MTGSSGPTYPGIIPYHTDPPSPQTLGPRLIGVEHRPDSVTGSYGPPSAQTLPGGLDRSHLTEEEAKEKYYQYWERQQTRAGWAPPTALNTSQITRQPSQGSSREGLLSPKPVERRPSWPRGSDFLASCWAFTLSLHSLWSLPISLIQNGGLAFLLMYLVCLAVLGAPLLLLELSLGQYSALPPARLFRHLCPLLAGLGLAFALQAALRAVLELALLMWAGQGLFLLFSEHQIRDGFFYRDVLGRGEASLESLGSLGGQLCLVLGVSALLTFLLLAAGTRALGKVCSLAIPLAFMLLVTLSIRACMESGGPLGLTQLFSPDWGVLTQPGVWLEAAGQVVFSLQLGLGALTTFASYNKFQHNLVRDASILVVSHLVWVILSLILTLALLGVAHTHQAINLACLTSPSSCDTALVSITGRDIWLATITLVETSLASVSFGWLWAGLFLLLLLITGITSLFGYLEVVTSSITAFRPSLLPYKPALTFLVLAVLFLLDLLLATQGGIHVYHLLTTYIASWPALLFSLLTVLAAVFCHGTNRLIRDLSTMSKTVLPHWVTSHLAVTYYSLLPAALLAALCWCLHSLSLEAATSPLANFGLSPPAWAPPLGWCLALLPCSPLILGAAVHLVWGGRPLPRLQHMQACLQPSQRWHRNRTIEIGPEGSVSTA